MITQMVFLATSLLRSGSCHLLRPHVNQSTVPCTLLLAFIHSLKSTPDTHPVPEAEHRSENKTNRALAPPEGALPSACTPSRCIHIGTSFSLASMPLLAPGVTCPIFSPFKGELCFISSNTGLICAVSPEVLKY